MLAIDYINALGSISLAQDAAAVREYETQLEARFGDDDAWPFVARACQDRLAFLAAASTWAPLGARRGDVGGVDAAEASRLLDILHACDN